MITFINRFEVTGPADEFEKAFDATSAFFSAQPGFIAHRLLQHIQEPGRYVNVADWQDEESFRAALARPEFAAHRTALRALSSSDPNLYTPTLERVAR
ncbi:MULTISPECIES: antibiotic biosynthesis monooxygenase family protein [unclassified Streptomyces]|uniref:antibiotic biosynthesis monooxygenase family protein n=1 Tax=unclassified Streptomyces TaxID=2593676 RepID=UPI002DDBEB89|nr:antibiotic biosynthesis monooxygenase family protein [Streptomyces sp. NBC_01750]WSA98226.1 antibiotic biosynthesis monooxygenase [Streptomyces sp. NBC_01794]WSD37237.1 antibiotic biosynthesis monooxygenase [Streptomyces sp. NBC_01750]